MLWWKTEIYLHAGIKVPLLVKRMWIPLWSLNSGPAGGVVGVLPSSLHVCCGLGGQSWITGVREGGAESGLVTSGLRWFCGTRVVEMRCDRCEVKQFRYLRSVSESGSRFTGRSNPQLWSWALSSYHKNEITDTSIKMSFPCRMPQLTLRDSNVKTSLTIGPMWENMRSQTMIHVVNKSTDSYYYSQTI